MPDAATPHRRRRWGVAVAVGALAAVAPAVDAGRPSAWRDESATVAMVDKSWADMGATLRHIDAVHAAYYVVLRCWAAVAGDSLTALRIFSALGVGVCAALVVALMTELVSLRTGAIAGLLCVLLPGLTWSGLEARGYAWSAAVAVAMTLALARAAWDRGRWAVYAVLCAAGIVWFLYLGLLVLAHGLVVALAARTRLVRWLGAAAAGGVVPLPVVLVALGQRTQVNWIRIPLGSLPSQLAHQVVPKLQGTPWRVAVLASPGAITCLLALLVLGVVAGLRSRDRAPVAVLVAAWLALPTVVLLLTIPAGLQLYQPRYTTFTAPAVACGAALGLEVLATRARWLAGVALVVVAATTLPLVASQHREHSKLDDYRALAGFARQEHADAVVFVPVVARGIALSYPADFAGRRDLLAAPDPGAIFGGERPWASVSPRQLRGQRLVVYTQAGASGAPTRRAVAAAGCTSTATLRDQKWRADSYAC